MRDGYSIAGVDCGTIFLVSGYFNCLVFACLVLITSFGSSVLLFVNNFISLVLNPWVEKYILLLVAYFDLVVFSL